MLQPKYPINIIPNGGDDIDSAFPKVRDEFSEIYSNLNKVIDGTTAVEHATTATNVSWNGVTEKPSFYTKEESDAKFEQITTKQSCGIEWNSDKDTVTRIGLSKDADRTLFDTTLPWSGMKRCNLRDDGVVLAYQGDPLYKSDGSYGQCMVEIPAFYFRKETLTFPTRIRWYISATPQAGFTLHPAFITNGVQKSKIYFSAYEGFINGSKMESKVGVQPTANYTIAQFRTLAQARGSGWQQQTFHVVSAIQMLFAIEYASFDTQGCIGRGVVDFTDNGSTNMSVSTGATASLGNVSGMATGTNGLVSVSYRGIENFWGNIWKFVDGINVKNYVPYVADNGYASDKFDAPYIPLNSTLPTASGYMSDVINCDSGFLPLKATGSSTTRFYDNYYCSPNSGNFVVVLGGDWAYAGNAGAFGWYSGVSSGYLGRGFASRLLFV